MKNEKYISFKSHSIGMENEGKTYEYPKKEKIGSLDYGATSMRDMDFDRYVRKIYEEEEALNNINPYEKEPLKPITDKVNDFLQRHTGMNYEQFVRYADPYNFEVNDFSTMPKKALRRRLFDHRAYLYLSALYDCEKEGIDISKLLERIRGERIPFIKKEREEPTYEAILRVLEKES